jgi:PAS domain S-box-containing protein
MGARLKYDPVLERQKTEEALRASEVRYRRLFETAQDGILILDGHSGLITDVNPFLVTLLDYSREEFIGKTLWDIGPFRNIEASKAAFQQLQEKEYIRYENLPLEAKGGRRVNVEFVSNVYGVNGTRVIQCNIRDITARKHAEKQAGEQVQQSQRMEAVGQLAGGLAHDFKNLLGVILGYCELLEHRFTPDGSNRRMVEQIHSAGTRAASLSLSGHPKTGQRWSGQNRPTGRGRGLSCFTLQLPVQASLILYANSADRI